MAQTTMVVAGIDTGKHKLDVALHGRKARLQVDNTEEGHAQLSRWLRRHKVVRVGIEATGGYERAVVLRLTGDGFEVIRFQPRQVRAYADYRLQRAKNDTIDARLVAACTAEAPAPRRPVEARFEALAEHLTLIEQIEDDIARLKTRLEATRGARPRRIVEDQIRHHKALLRRELAQLVQDLRRHRDLARRLDLVMSVDGVGERTALAFVIRMPELGSLTREEAASLVGLAPYDDDTGQRHGQRHIKGGRARLRKAVYAAALPAAFQWNPALIAFYKRLRDAGKDHKPALVAVARKLVIYVNTVVARDEPWVSTRAN